METDESNPSKKSSTSFPPKRGQIKAQIFGSFVETLVSVASKAKEALGRTRRGSGDSSTVSPPPSSAYASASEEGNSDPS